MKKWAILLCSTMWAGCACAGLSEGILAYEYQQYPTALSEFTYLKDEGDPAAAYYLAKMYQEGKGVTQNLAQAQNLLQAASDGHYFPATAELGRILVFNETVPLRQTQQGMALLKTAALAGESEAAFNLGQVYANAIGVDENLSMAYGFYLIAALGGNARAQYQLGKMYFDGRGIPQDYDNALKWLSRSANQGYVLAQVDIADLRNTHPRFKHAGQAYSWYSIIAAYNTDEVGRLAAEKRDVLGPELDDEVLMQQQSMVRSWKPIGALESVPEQERETTEIPLLSGFNDVRTLQDLLSTNGFLPRNAGRYGLTNSMIDRAISQQDVGELENKIEQASIQGKTDAFGYLGDLYKIRFNNDAEALIWYQKGAEVGDTYAQYQLAKMYCEGQGLSQPDAVTCYKWLLKVQEAQNPLFNGLVQGAISMVQANATPEELAQGQAQAQDQKTNKTSFVESVKKGEFSFF